MDFEGANVRCTDKMTLPAFQEDVPRLETPQSAEEWGREVQANSNSSSGSAGHPRRCKPCAFYHLEKGCATGDSCNFCHLCELHEIKERKHRQKKWKRKRRFMQSCQAAAATVAAASVATAATASSADAIAIDPSVPAAELRALVLAWNELIFAENCWLHAVGCPEVI